MRRITSLMVITFALLFGMTAMSHAWGLPKLEFHRDINRALQKERWNHPEEAREYWQKALESGEELMQAVPNKTEYFIGSARCSYALGDYARATTLYNLALQIQADKGGDPNLAKHYPWIYVYLGLSYAKLGDTANAIETWEQVPSSIGTTYRTIHIQLAKFKKQQIAEVK
ncbi:tetratricopeptide repeat protein [Pseudodesulfovibrio sediminis]|uniref:Tetratricopeptide repeat protein n=1 Tax=Pseudodesulfovibrio sediminis TaxID=2810563 RepID=A0ABN6ES71_9BACT|nr:tetratricopeptide repeat protein [Pseudodesulfovibrio sediminis]BCS88099.1 hypothetical protein PSDVSF_13410 [Pseudodesulfovibrio sediminis]